MKEISKFQVIRIDEKRVIIRFYSEKRDRFERVCVCQRYKLHSNSLLVADDKVYFIYDGEIFSAGEGKNMLTADYEKLVKFDVKSFGLPFETLFIVNHSQFGAYMHFYAKAYETEGDRNIAKVTIRTVDGETYVYTYGYTASNGIDAQDIILSWRAL